MLGEYTIVEANLDGVVVHTMDTPMSVHGKVKRLSRKNPDTPFSVVYSFDGIRTVKSIYVDGALIYPTRSGYFELTPGNLDYHLREAGVNTYGDFTFEAGKLFLEWMLERSTLYYDVSEIEQLVTEYLEERGNNE